jgi:benzylsuccinate CoA-transferase BbsF subunit
MDYVFNGRSGGPKSNEHPLAACAPYGVFRCAGDDRWISIAIGSEEEWQALVMVMGEPDWARAAEFANMAGRLSNIDDLHARIGAWTVGFDDRELAARLQEQGVAGAPVLNIADLLADPHYRERKTYIEVTHPLGYKETIYGAYVKTSRSKPDVRPGPMIGQDNEKVFRKILGLSEERYNDLVERQVIY